MFLLWFANTLQIEDLIHLVPKVLEPNKLPIWQSVTKHITKMKCLKLKKKKKKKKLKKKNLNSTQINFMQKLLKTQCFMNEMHEYEIKFFSKTLEFNPNLPKTSFSINLSSKLKH